MASNLKPHPRRIVALSAESADLLQQIGAWERVVGASAYYVAPRGVAPRPRISGFSHAAVEKIVALRPDLAITFSDVQAAIAERLIREGIQVLATNPRTLEEIEETMRLIGRSIGCETRCEKRIARWKARLKPVPAAGSKPRVYFEEWNDPLVTGIAWVSELIEAAGGTDVFASRRSERAAKGRVICAGDVMAAEPDVIIASWCGQKADLAAMTRRPGWSDLRAVKLGQLYELDSSEILQPGLRLEWGFETLKKWFGAAITRRK
jgi:iron complex transport system substrate-binding protein